MRFHKGVDLAASAGTPIVAAADGRVVGAGWHGGYGQQVEIAHAGGLETTYGHMSRIAAHFGQIVRKGEVIGFVGSTGLSTGPHVHYEVRRNGIVIQKTNTNILLVAALVSNDPRYDPGYLSNYSKLYIEDELSEGIVPEPLVSDQTRAQATRVVAKACADAQQALAANRQLRVPMQTWRSCSL